MSMRRTSRRPVPRLAGTEVGGRRTRLAVPLVLAAAAAAWAALGLAAGRATAAGPAAAAPPSAGIGAPGSLSPLGGGAPHAAAADGAVPVASDAYRQELMNWRADRYAGLKNPGGWLTVVGLFWLDEGENRLGSDAANRVVLPAGKAPAVAGTLIRHGGDVTVHAEASAGVTSGGKPVTDLALAPDDQGKPVILELGGVSFFVIKRGDRVGVRVKDRDSAALTAFHGVETFPLDPSWRVVARFEPHAKPETIPVTNVLGMTDQEPSPGVVVFEHRGKTYRLDALKSDDGGLFLIFGDQTNGRETYGAGRFLDTQPPRDGSVVVDFNKAYNPPCAFTAFATCPLPPPHNRLALAVDAGERKYAGGPQHP
jgi:uncharacterized protein (DUF1684 family)